MAIDPICIAPTLFNKIDLTVEFQQKNDLEATCLTSNLKVGFDIDKIRLIVKDPSAAAISSAFCTLEILALCKKLWCISIPSF